MLLKTQSYRVAVCLLAAIMLMSFCGAALAYNDACPCCGFMAQSDHMQEPSSADCCNTPTCDHCTINADQKPTPMTATVGSNNIYRKHPPQFFTVLVAPIINLVTHWDHPLKNNAPLDIHAKIPIYISTQSILC